MYMLWKHLTFHNFINKIHEIFCPLFYYFFFFYLKIPAICSAKFLFYHLFPDPSHFPHI